MDTLLTVQNLNKTFGVRRVLSDVGFTICAGEVVGLIGPNGEGKTTVLECLAGLLPSNAGTFEYLGRPLSVSHRKEALFYVPDGINYQQVSVSRYTYLGRRRLRRETL
ncbi:MAG TPA: ATP-binding cassette domain-containing protein [Pyrinomonadaceae bacterium]|nr:ATP-binding cassette domain-containing protein [Pyrinomonadaceae bacterium]